MADKKTSDQLQLQPKLTLEAVLVAKQAELQSQQSLVLHHEQQHRGEVSKVQIEKHLSPQGASPQQGRQSENDGREDVFIGGLWLNELGTDKWTTTVKIVDFERSVNFLNDTGVDVSCVPTSVVPEQMLQIVKKAEEPISGPDGYRLKVIGFLDLVLETKDKQTRSTVLVISGLQNAKLGRQCL
ncbi:hypothetical protein PR048_016831 [Dryococelus australis]|uniref:Uncharacterized protein n=1 Tax=Dryococelus australis TaxID=614101 RepID=A0ABQ9H7X2_9NEOP|nr:hypothetical protein PR048_016831 [Dryococelus australis]